MKFSWWQLAALGVGVVALVTWQNLAASRGAMAAPDALSGASLSPLQRAFGATGSYFGDVGRVIARRGDIAGENARLKTKVAALESQNARLQLQTRENRELRRLLSAPKVRGGKNLLAEVVWAPGGDFARRLTLNVGARARVKLKDVAYCAEGLVGQVTQVGPWTSVVTLPTDTQGAVGAVVARSGARGVVTGTGNRAMKLAYLDFGSDVREGDAVVTSGLVNGRGAVFPRGIALGRVFKVTKNAAYGRQEAVVEPAVSFDRVSHVWVRVDAN